MTIHAKNGKPGCISFRFMNFLFSGGDLPPPSDAPEGGVIFFFAQEEGYGMTIHAKNGKSGYQFSFQDFFILRGGTYP